MAIRFSLGNDNFSKLRQEDGYYIDKTELISRILSENFEAYLITRPRRFGKTLTMSMLEDFFDITRDSRADFAGLKITEDRELCGKWMNRWPTLFVSLKSIEGMAFTDAYKMLEILVSDYCIEHIFLLENDRISVYDKEVFKCFMAKTASKEEIKNSLYILTRMLSSYYGRQAILLIDEYDVPLAKASENDYYNEMLDLIRAMLGKVLKTNEFLKFAVITGCLKIAKESIFTGINNVVSDTISSDRFAEYLGFTEQNVDKILEDAGFADHAKEMRIWYDGYRFGTVDVYCPWDVLNHVAALQVNPQKKPQNYWGATSHNGAIYRFISRDDLDVNQKFEILMSGGCLRERITEELTYDTIQSSEKNLWSLLYATGYLTQGDLPKDQEPLQDEEMILRIPNEEVKSIFKTTIIEWFHDSVRAADRKELFAAIWEGNDARATELISDILFTTISYHDYKESYYHAFVAGLFAGGGYIVESNYELGTGRPDVIIKDNMNRRAVILEAKHVSSESKLVAGCENAIKQIRDRQYAAGLKGYRSILCYGIAFYDKECLLKRME